MASITKISLFDVKCIPLYKYKFVWVGINGGNYDLYTGLNYIPFNINENSLGTLFHRDKYYKLFGNLERKKVIKKVIKKQTTYQKCLIYIKIFINYILSYINF